MKDFLSRLNIKIEEQVFIKDPDTSDLGRKIIKQSILLIDEIGFESFTFRKLAKRIGSTEASVYRYFENKHKLLIYLVAWYWHWMEYQLFFATNNISSPETRLDIVIELLSKPIETDPDFSHVDEVALQRIVISESSKAYLTKEIDEDNKEGYFATYKRLCKFLANIISEVNPKYKFPLALSSTLVQTVLEQKYFAEHLSSITEVDHKDKSSLTAYLKEMVLKTIK